MAEKKRQCGTCRFFVENEASGHGKCTHPKRAGTDAELLLLRPTELACRTKWGDSLWQDPEDESDPMKPQSPQQPTLPEPIAAQLQFDDEVTSVSIAGSKSSRSSFEDDVVDSGATTTGMASWNDPVQDERLDLLRKGSQDALAGARKRHLEKQARQRELIPFAEDDEVAKSNPAHESTQNEESEAPAKLASERTPAFPADDFVEDEKSAADDDSRVDDEMVDDGVAPDQHRSPRLRKLLREPNNPKKNEAMRFSMPSEMRVTSNNPDNREEWNSVPTLNPGFELPMRRTHEQQNSSPIKVAASAAPMATSSYQPRPVSQARELLSEDRLRNERAQRQMVAPIVDEEAQQPQALRTQLATDRQRLTKAPARDAAPLDRVKKSPLRGLQQATQKPATTEREPLVPRQRDPYQESNRQLSQQPTHTPEQPYQYSASPEVQERPRAPQPRQQREQQARPVRRIAEQPDLQQSERRVESRQPQYQEQRAPERRRPMIPLHEVATPFEREAIEISPDVPRCCGTCASFQPSDVAGRGSCSNRFAGPVQRVVYDQDLACQHTYGSLWLPADEEVWLEELRTDYPPTPRVDAMLARRRRRENPVLPDLEELTS